MPINTVISSCNNYSTPQGLLKTKYVASIGKPCQNFYFDSLMDAQAFSDIVKKASSEPNQFQVQYPFNIIKKD